MNTKRLGATRLLAGSLTGTFPSISLDLGRMRHQEDRISSRLATRNKACRKVSDEVQPNIFTGPD